MGIWVIALSLVFNGVAAYAWNIPSEMQAAIAHDHHDGASIVACDVTSDEDVAMAADVGHAHEAKHNHLKCCGACNIASLGPSAAAVPVTFAYRAATFETAQNNLVGHLVALDPDIPKSFV